MFGGDVFRKITISGLAVMLCIGFLMIWFGKGLTAKILQSVMLLLIVLITYQLMDCGRFNKLLPSHLNLIIFTK